MKVTYGGGAKSLTGTLLPDNTRYESMNAIIVSWCALTHPFAVSADGIQEIGHDGEADAFGLGWCDLNTAFSVNLLSCFLEHDAFLPTAAHLHRVRTGIVGSEDQSLTNFVQGAAGLNGPVIYGFDSAASPIRQVRPFSKSEKVFTPILTSYFQIFTMQDDGSYTVARQVKDLNLGLFYLNVHSDGIPSGAIRGQLVGKFSNEVSDNT